MLSKRAEKVFTSNSLRWDSVKLNLAAKVWLGKMKSKQKNVSYKSMWWSYIFSWSEKLDPAINTFINGVYRFNPVSTYRFTGYVITTWNYADRLILNFLRKIITPVMKHLISPNCYHLNGPAGIKEAINYVENSMNQGGFRYFIRADIKDYYASIDHEILVNQTKKYFHDLKLCKYLEDVITVAIDDGGEIKLPTKGIPRASSLSPIFGALYLSELDEAFKTNTGISYCRFMDDIVILAKTKRQFLRAKKRMRQILLKLKLKLSRTKTLMGELTKGFHFLGVNFAVSRNQQKEIHVAKSLHARTYSRALDKLNAMEEGAGNPEKVLRYLSNWATWWCWVMNYKFIDFKLLFFAEREKKLSRQLNNLLIAEVN